MERFAMCFMNPLSLVLTVGYSKELCLSKAVTLRKFNLSIFKKEAIFQINLFASLCTLLSYLFLEFQQQPFVAL